jgi:predicted dienelactone hydrolase
VNHTGNNAAEPYTAEGFSIWWERARDLSETISGILADAKFGDRIDPKRIGAAGFSLGGYTMIAVAGGILDMHGFIRLCDSPNAGKICTATWRIMYSSIPAAKPAARPCRCCASTRKEWTAMRFTPTRRGGHCNSLDSS